MARKEGRGRSKENADIATERNRSKNLSNTREQKYSLIDLTDASCSPSF